MNLIQGAFLGLVQGLTEFLPVSSSGHLVLLQQYLNIDATSESFVLFDAILHSGTLLAILFLFRTDIYRIIKSIFNWSSSDDESRTYRKMAGFLVVGSVPLAVIGYTFNSSFEILFKSIPTVAIMLIVTGIILLIAEKFSANQGARSDFSKIKLSDSIWVGVAQTFALLPGLSRSGATITAGLIRGLDRQTAARFSFLFSVPAIIGASGFSIFNIKTTGSIDFPILVVSTFVAFLSGLAAITALLYIIERRKLRFFSIYCFTVGFLAFALNYL